MLAHARAVYDNSHDTPLVGRGAVRTASGLTMIEEN
jgi:hypothetical protein